MARLLAAKMGLNMGWQMGHFKMAIFEHETFVLVNFVVFDAEDGPLAASHVLGASIGCPHALVILLAQVPAQSKANTGL